MRMDLNSSRVVVKTNKYQTAITEELLNSLPKEVQNEFLDYINSVRFIKWIIQPEEVRGYARNRPRYSSLPDGHPDKFYSDDRIIVDVTRPHILENMDWFRERALFFEKNGRYTNIPPNPSKKSDWTAFWKNELHRWKYGLVRPEDGEWIPGSLYFYWNYGRIWLVSEENGLITRKAGFPKPWLGDYLFYHYKEQARVRNSHVKMLKARGIGASFKMAAESARNMYVFPGSGNPNFHLAFDKVYIEGDKGVFGKVIDNLDWIASTTPLPKLRIGDAKRDLFIQLGYTDQYGIRKGLLSSVYGISLKDNPDKARGVRGPLIHYEEDGLFPNLIDAWNINRKSVEEGNLAFGQMIALGTGGTEKADFTGAEKLFYHPKSFNIYAIPNVFDKNTDDSSTCAFFWGSYLNRSKCYDDDVGEPDVVKALIELLTKWHSLKMSSPDTKTIMQAMAEEPIVPQQAIMNVERNPFPTYELKAHLGNIMSKYDKFISEHYVGKLVIDGNGKVSFEQAMDMVPIRDFPFTGAGKVGAVEIFELPKGNFPFRYILGVDTFDDDDVKESVSLGSVFVFDRWTRRLVAEYTGRPVIADDFYEIVRRLSLFYNGTIMYENNKKGLFAYFKSKNSLHLLADTPDFLKDRVVMKPRMGELYNTSKGINALAEINAYARRLQMKWMLSTAYMYDGTSINNMLKEERMEDEQGEAMSDEIINVYSIRSIGYIKECLAWNGVINTDRVNAMNMVMLYDEALRNYDTETVRVKIKTKAEDDFFTRRS